MWRLNFVLENIFLNVINQLNIYCASWCLEYCYRVELAAADATQSSEDESEEQNSEEEEDDNESHEEEDDDDDEDILDSNDDHDESEDEEEFEEDQETLTGLNWSFPCWRFVCNCLFVNINKIINVLTCPVCFLISSFKEN